MDRTAAIEYEKRLRAIFENPNEVVKANPTGYRAGINWQNARKSSGPRIEEGTRASSLNAVKTSLTDRTVLLESDDVELYEQNVTGWFAELEPEGLHEITLVQSIPDSKRHGRS